MTGQETNASHPASSIPATDVEHFEEHVLHNPLPVLLDFWGPGCTRCFTLLPSIEKLAQEHAGKLAVYKINSRENWRVAVSLKVSSLPTVLLFRAGVERVRLTGEFAAQDVARAVDELLVEE